MVLVGGQRKHVGKTTLVCNIIGNFPQFKWTAVKITSHPHSAKGAETVASGMGWTLSEQKRADTDSDTGRFLQAGAAHAILVYCQAEALGDACSALLPHLSNSNNSIVESSSALGLLRPDLSLLVIEPGSSDFKASAREQFANFDALVVRKESLRALEQDAIVCGNTPVLRSQLHGIDPDLTRLLGKLLHKS